MAFAKQAHVRAGVPSVCLPNLCAAGIIARPATAAAVHAGIPADTSSHILGAGWKHSCPAALHPGMTADHH